jgi:tetratricopeptide (TPR) repeat protein
MLPMALALLTMIQAAQPAQLDDIKDALAHADALYYGARFTESVDLLTRVDETLHKQPGRLQEKIDTKLKLALSNIGLNDPAKAKALLMELYALDSNFTLDPNQFSPKVVAVAAEAKADQAKIQCQSAQTDAHMYLETGNAHALLELVRSMQSKCVALTAIGPEAAESFYKAGVAAYRRGEFPNALSQFEAAVTLSPEHELAFQYIDLTKNKLQLGQDRLLLQWQKDFEAHQLTAAASDYRQMVSSKSGSNSGDIKHVTDEYRKALTTLVQNWNQTCSTADAATLNALRGQITELLPEPAFGEDIRAGMNACAETRKSANANKPVDATDVARGRDSSGDSVFAQGNAAIGCLAMDSQLALTRLKTRVDPAISNELRYYLKTSGQLTVRIKTRISESGDVTVTGMPDGNPLLNSVISRAVSQWKFSATRDSSGPRCIDTEIPIIIKLTQTQ